MPHGPTRDPLNEHAYIIVVLRVMVDQECQLKYAEVVDAAGTSWGWHAGWPAVTAAVQACLASGRSAPPRASQSDEPPAPASV